MTASPGTIDTAWATGNAADYGAAQAARWLTMADSINPDAALAYEPRPYMLAGYPVAEGQGEILPDGSLTGWFPDDFNAARARGQHIARICNLTPTAACSIADVESGAITYAGARTFVIGREGHRPGTSTIYASLDNWPAVGRAVRGLRLSWAWVAFWPNYPTDVEVADIESRLAQDVPGTKLAAIQYRNLSASNVDLSVIIDPTWALRP